MAAEFVGGALLSAFLQVAFDRLASPKVLDFFRRRKLDEKLLNNLNIMLHSIDVLVDDAEQKQLRDPRVRAWIFAVKDAVFDAEDLLDEIDYEVTKCEVEAELEPQTFTYKVSNFFSTTFSSFNKKIDSGMKEVLEKLEYLARQKSALGLKECTYSSVRSGSNVSQKLPSTSLVVESVIYGRDADKEMIFNWLTSAADNRNQPSILSIVGIGGLGKTTLAQHVYNDPRMDEAKFDIKAWVCVSDDFDVLRVTKAILEAITKSKDDSGDLEMVHGRLKEKLAGKRFLLVLDDVWSERREEWEAVRTPLSYGAQGSRILVTTRSKKVTSNMRSEVHWLGKLQEDDCWDVFEKHALKDDKLKLNDELKEIGAKIVEKCKGLPLALKTIGSLLRTKSSISEWKSVLESNIWDLPKEDSEIIPSLYLSYHYLPSHLKRCFAYCALFPKDYVFGKEELILLWMAENFLQFPQQSKSLEEVGEQYFDDLLSRSFFQSSTEYGRHFVMHDLVNDLAKYVSGDICYKLKFDKGRCIPKSTRHFSFKGDDVKYFDGFGSLTEAKRLRTFLPVKIIGGIYFDPYSWQFNISIHELFSQFKFFRVLSLSRCSQLKEVPDSVGDLKYLHSLNLSRTGIRKLPDSICFLYNLLILNLNYCFNLEELPPNLHKLTKLRYLEFQHTKVTKMPLHLGELKNLQVLSKFYVDIDSECSTKQLGGLNPRELSIEQLQNVVNPSYAMAVDLKNKTHLVRLKLKWNSDHIPDDPRKEKEVLENLQPSKHLESLSISNYGGTQFPRWLFDDSLSNMVSLRLVDCKYCLCLPALGLLSSLKTLEIRGLDGIVSVGAEFYGNGSSSFPSLEALFFKEMMEWEEWECKTAAFSRLERLYLETCPKLKVVPEQLLHLKQLLIYYSIEASFLKRSGHNVSDNSLQALSLCTNPIPNIPMSHCYNLLENFLIMNSCNSLTTFPLDLFPKLKFLQLYGCPNLQMISQEHTHNRLGDLIIADCPQFESFPSEGLSAPLLTKLQLEGLENLKLLPKSMHILLPSLTELWIKDCPQVEMFPDGGLPSNLKYLSLSSFKLTASLNETLDANTCLETLIIQKMDVESFPDEGFLPLSFSYLALIDFPDLKKLDYKGLCHLSSLKTLRLCNCPSLQCLPEEGLPKSISTLQICGCPLLEQRCQQHEGEDWGKIAHIEQVDIGE
ncbi:unnamed protein product [Sphenostylis stenocarpa]|uniref:Disease resistance RPP13-like protein 1 n=1 Tax=Sphenostylis stenocarpa TaxID=92480 RepID=A0AA86VY00_9FABA|nr:unnamed protein product [Sphenostylis stenocarpa]